MHSRLLSCLPSRLPSRRPRAGLLAAVTVAAAALSIAGCGSSGEAAHARPGQIAAVGAENEYADVISQIGGRYVSVNAIESNPNTDPHTFEASASVAQEVAGARLVVQNGVGYDDYMQKIEAASPSSSRRVVDVQHLLGLPDSTSNPHLWYLPRTMPAVAAKVAADLSDLQPDHRAYFAANLARFDASLKPWLAALASLRAAHPGVPVAVTEPVGDDMLQAAGARIMTPWTLQADIMNGVDPSPQDVSLQNGLFTGHRVKVFLYNEQVTDSLTESFLKLAAAQHIPVVGVYETMPLGYHYQSWMLSEVYALSRAAQTGQSTTRL